MIFLTLLLNVALAMPLGYSLHEPEAISARAAVWGMDSDYVELRAVALRIMEEYPPYLYSYVGVGRSPTPLTALFRALLGKDAVYNLPLSNLNAEFINVRSAEMEDRHDEFLKRFLPKDGRRILLIDYAARGGSIENARTLVRGYFWRHPDRKVEAFALASNHATAESLARRGIRSHVLGDRLFVRLNRRMYAAYSEFDRYNVANPPERFPRRRGDAFEVLVSEFRRRATVDPVFRRTGLSCVWRLAY